MEGFKALDDANIALVLHQPPRAFYTVFVYFITMATL